MVRELSYLISKKGFPSLSSANLHKLCQNKVYLQYPEKVIK